MRIKVRVIPRARKEKIENTDGTIKVYISKPPIEGRANKRLIQMLANYLNVKKSDIAITQGLKSRNKIVEINEPERK